MAGAAKKMNKIQKKAVIRLAVIGFLATISATILFLYQQPPLWDVVGGLGFMWLIFTPALIDPPPFVPFRKKGKIIVDERDARIVQRATAQAFGAFWYVFPILVAGIYLFVNAYRTEGLGTISSGILTIIAGGGVILVTLVQSISIIAQYRKGGGDGDK
jgi:hypothetical protein